MISIVVINPENFSESLEIPMKRVTINTLIDIGRRITFIPSLITGLVLETIILHKFSPVFSGIFLSDEITHEKSS